MMNLNFTPNTRRVVPNHVGFGIAKIISVQPTPEELHNFNENMENIEYISKKTFKMAHIKYNEQQDGFVGFPQLSKEDEAYEEETCVNIVFLIELENGVRKLLKFSFFPFVYTGRVTKKKEIGLRFITPQLNLLYEKITNATEGVVYDINPSSQKGYVEKETYPLPLEANFNSFNFSDFAYFIKSLLRMDNNNKDTLFLYSNMIKAINEGEEVFNMFIRKTFDTYKEILTRVGVIEPMSFSIAYGATMINRNVTSRAYLIGPSYVQDEKFNMLLSIEQYYKSNFETAIDGVLPSVVSRNLHIDIKQLRKNDGFTVLDKLAELAAFSENPRPSRNNSNTNSGNTNQAIQSSNNSPMNGVNYTEADEFF